MNMNSEYKSLRTVIMEAMSGVITPKPTTPADAASANTPKKTAPDRKKGETWKTASGHFAAMNPEGNRNYFDDEERAKAYAKGQDKGGSVDNSKVDTSREVPLDDQGFAKQEPQAADKKPSSASGEKPMAPVKPTAPGKPSTTTKPATEKPAASQQAEPSEEHPDVLPASPKTKFDSPPAGFHPIGMQGKRDIRKANVVAKLVKNKTLVGPQDDKDSVFGDAQTERDFAEEMNAAALSALRGGEMVDFELCSKTFAQIGFCHDPKTGKKIDKGIKRKEMPQFSSNVDREKPDSPAYKKHVQETMKAKGYTSPDQMTDEDWRQEVKMESEFAEQLEKSGYEVREEDASVTGLKPIQTELEGTKVASMYASLVAADADPDAYGEAATRLKDPIYVSDGYVVDGHHRWAAMCAKDIADGKGGANVTMRTKAIYKDGKPVPIDEIIKFSNDFMDSMGLAKKSRPSGAGKPQTKPTQEKPMKQEPQKESFGFGSRSSRLQRIVQTITESVEMQEAQKRKADRSPAMGTMAAGVDADDASRYTAAAKPMKARKTDRFGNLMKAKKTVVHDTNSADENIESAQDLIVNMVGVMVGTKMEIQGTKNGKPYTLKLKKIRKDGRDTYETVSGREVEPRAAGTGLQIVDKRGSKVVLDRGTDIYWD
jgi:hypothetical protein